MDVKNELFSAQCQRPVKQITKYFIILFPMSLYVKTYMLVLYCIEF